MKKSQLKEIIKEELSKALNEISPELFRSATNVSKERGTNIRTQDLGTTYFNQFIGKPIFSDLNGKIVDIWYERPSSANFEEVNIQVSIERENKEGELEEKKGIIKYDVNQDKYEYPYSIYGPDKRGITRKDAWVLSQIAKKINPNTKYKEPGKHFEILGY